MKAKALRIALRSLLLLLLVGFLIRMVIVPIGQGVAATRMPRVAVGTPPEGFANVSLTTRDGERLAGWYAPPRNGAVILALHGASNSREAIRPYALMFTRHGFGVLAMDLRGHGESEGQPNYFGWEGGADVEAALRFLSAQPDVATLGGFGLSLGGQVLLSAAAAQPALPAIISEGAAHHSMDEFYLLPYHRTPLFDWQSWFTYTTVRVITGDTPPTPIQDSLAATEATRFLLIAAENVADEVAYNTAYAEAASGRADVWTISGVGHIGGFAHDPEDYERRTIAFFTETLLSPAD